MTRTVVSSAASECVIGFEEPFVVIGERINPTGRRQLAEEMRNGDYSRVERDALAQVNAGAAMLDVNAGIPLADEARILVDIVQLVQGLVDVPLCIDSSVVGALEAGLAVYEGKALVNSVTGEEDRLESVLPLVRKHGAAVVAISNDEQGISHDPEVRFEVARKIVERAVDYGIPSSDVVVDPLVMPTGAVDRAGRSVLHLLFLRGIVGPGDTLIIEEPEAHLHPAAQTKVALTLGRLVRAGVRVIITTHSDWLLEQIGNLVREGEVMKLGKNKTEPTTWLTKEEVGAWWFRESKSVKEIPFDSIEGIEPKDYYDVAEELHNNAVEFQQHLLNEEELGDDE